MWRWSGRKSWNAGINDVSVQNDSNCRVIESFRLEENLKIIKSTKLAVVILPGCDAWHVYLTTKVPKCHLTWSLPNARCRFKGAQSPCLTFFLRLINNLLLVFVQLIPRCEDQELKGYRIASIPQYLQIPQHAHSSWNLSRGECLREECCSSQVHSPPVCYTEFEVHC